MKSLLNFIFPQKPQARRKSSLRDLIRKESVIGSRIFGIVHPNHRREFFCLDQSTWIWYEEWVDEAGTRRVATTRYEIHGQTLLKQQTGRQTEIVTGDELSNFSDAVRRYYEEVADKVYSRPIKH